MLEAVKKGMEASYEKEKWSGGKKSEGGDKRKEEGVMRGIKGR